MPSRTMLQFFKKSGQKNTSRSSHSLEIQPTNFEKSTNGTNEQSSLSGTVSICSLNEEEEKKICEKENIDTCFYHSRLSKTLPEILADKGALGYFIQYMDSKDSIALIKFWLEVECLCNASLTQENLESHYECLDFSQNCVTNYNESVASNYLINSEHNGFLSEKEDKWATNTKSNNSIPKTKHISKNLKFVRDEFDKERNPVLNTKKDALRLYKKYIASNALGPNRIPDELKAETEKAVTSENTETLLNCLSTVQKIVYIILEDEYVNDFLRSSLHCKHQIDVLTSGNVQLFDILYEETALFYFIEFMELESRRELLDFWMTAINYKQNFVERGEIINLAEAQSDALVIYEKYFSLQATTPLRFSNRIRFQIEQNICREDGKGPQPDCFDKPCKIVYYFLNEHYLPAFLSSQLYYKYLSELISTIQNSMCPTLRPLLKKTDSDCSSEISSVSTHISYSQKSEGDEKKLTKRSTLNGNMSIDTKQLYDPDSLWKRNKKSFSVGYVDNMGRFITEIEPDPRRKNGKESRLSRAVKRLVHMEQDKTKEELAWKIAEMIVRDITSLTLGPSNISSS